MATIAHYKMLVFEYYDKNYLYSSKHFDLANKCCWIIFKNRSIVMHDLIPNYYIAFKFTTSGVQGIYDLINDSPMKPLDDLTIIRLGEYLTTPGHTVK